MAASTPSRAPRSIMKILPPPPSSAGVPSTTSEPPTSSTTEAAPKAAPSPAAAITLCPQAWPISGRASYSQQMATVGLPEPILATKAVSRS